MAERIDIRLLGDKALARRLKPLVPKVETKILRRAMRQDIRPVLASG